MMTTVRMFLRMVSEYLLPTELFKTNHQLCGTEIAKLFTYL